MIVDTACTVIGAWDTDKLGVPKDLFQAQNWKCSAQSNLSKSFLFIPNYLSSREFGTWLTFWFESGFFFTFFLLLKKKKAGLVKDTSLKNFGLHNCLFITVCSGCF